MAHGVSGVAHVLHCPLLTKIASRLKEAGENGRVWAVLPLMLLPPAIDPGPAV
jgi:hypothetical protein